MKIKVFHLFENKIVTSGKKNEFGNSYQMKRMDKIKFIIHGLKATAMIQINFTVYIGISIFICCFCCRNLLYDTTQNSNIYLLKMFIYTFP